MAYSYIYIRTRGIGIDAGGEDISIEVMAERGEEEEDEGEVTLVISKRHRWREEFEMSHEEAKAIAEQLEMTVETSRMSDEELEGFLGKLDEIDTNKSR